MKGKNQQMQRNGQQQQPQYYQQQQKQPMQSQQNKFNNNQQQQLAYQQQQQQMQMIAKAKAAGLTMEEIYGDEMDDYYDEEMENNGMQQMDANQLAYYQQQQQMQQQNLYAQQQYASGGFADSSSGGDALIAEGFEILEEELDEDYDPTAAEIEEYARYLGMDMDKDKGLFYIAKEGLKAPLPGPWKPCKSPGGQIYYYNFSSKELQKDHPCDDYYRKYYIQEKSLLAKKKEETVIKKHIKQQQKVQQQQQMEIGNNSMGKSGTSQSAMLQQMMNIPLDVSVSAVDDIVNTKLDQIVAELEEQQIAYDRKCREELKYLDQNKLRQIQQIQNDAEEEIEYIANKVKAEVQIQVGEKKKALDQNKKKKLQDEMKQRVEEARAKEQERIEAEKQKLENQAKKEGEKVKQAEQKQLDKSTQQLKTQTAEDLLKQKEEIKREIASFANRSTGDTDAQIEEMRKEILVTKLRAEMNTLENEFQRKLNELKITQDQDSDEQKRRVKKDFEAKLQREKQQFKTKEQSSHMAGASLADQKGYIREEQDDQIKEKKRQVERETKEKIRLSRANYEQGLEKAKNDLKAKLQSEQDRQIEAIEHQIQDLILKSNTKAQDQEERLRYVIESKKDEIEYQFKSEWDLQKSSYQTQASLEGIQAVKSTISSLKTKVYQQESKERELQRTINDEQEGSIRTKSDITSKQRKLTEVTRATALYQEQEVANMESELRLRDDELQRVTRKINDRREQLIRGTDQSREKDTRGDQLLQKASDMRLKYMQQEIDSLKLQLKEIALREKDAPAGVSRPHRNYVLAAISDVIDYSVAEMTTQVDFDLPISQKMIQKITQEQTMTRQLLANIERNRIKWRKELFDNDRISVERKVALQSVKDKLDQQAMNMQEELSTLEQKINKAKRQEQSLLTLREQLKRMEKERNNELVRALLKEIQLAFDRYLKTHQPPTKSRFSRSDQEKEVSDFRTRWAQYVVDDIPESQDLKPMLGLNHYETAPKPFRLFSHYDTHTSWRQRSRLLVDHEIGKLNRNRILMRSFLGQQLTFLSNLKTATAT